PGGDLSFTARIEVEPEIELSKVEGLTVERLRRDVTDADIDRSMEELRTRYASWVPCEDGAVEGDQLSCDIQENDSMGLPVDNRLYKNIQVELGKGQYGPDFDSKMLGIKSGESRDLSITNPEDDPDPETAGKTEYYTVTVHEVKRAEKAELNDEFAQEIPPGFDTLAALKEHARGELAKSLERSIEQGVNNRIVEQLIAENPFEVPQKMIDLQLEDLLDRAKKGTSNPIDDDIVRSTYAPQIENSIRWNMIAKAVLKKQGIRIGDAEIQAEIERIATEQGQTVETVQLQLKRGDAMRKMAESLVERALFDYLRSVSTIVDKEMDASEA
ncbi:MAG: trigger factor, partial [Candidatus Cloacimonetes bacterium]|nr:trigger factor [Candidatus Cloacimonadota bacterium]